MTTSARWTLAVAVLVVALIAALTVELRRPSPPPPAGSIGAGQPGAGAGSTGEAGLAEARQRADLQRCPTGPGGTGPAMLRGLIVECAGDGAPVAAADVVAGRRVVLNMWAYWCVPCRAELPAMAEYQRRAGPAVLVVTVHQDPNEVAALDLLAQLGVRLPTLQDGSRRIAAALRVPNVMPATVVLAADGSVADVLPREFADADQIAAAIDRS